MTTENDRRYRISEVGKMTGVPIHLLRQWECRFPQLKPKRDRADRRRYTMADVEIVRRIKQLLRHEKLTTEGARIRLAQELYGEGQPRTRQDVIDLIDDIESQVRGMIDLIDSGS